VAGPQASRPSTAMAARAYRKQDMAILQLCLGLTANYGQSN
jgi:hypothetical protein